MESPAIRSLHHASYPPDALVAAKQGTTVTVCLPAKNEARTVGAIVEAIRTELVERHALVDEILVVDDASTDPPPHRPREPGPASCPPPSSSPS